MEISGDTVPYNFAFVPATEFLKPWFKKLIGLQVFEIKDVYHFDIDVLA